MKDLKNGGQSKGYAFVAFDTHEAALDALRKLVRLSELSLLKVLRRSCLGILTQRHVLISRPLSFYQTWKKHDLSFHEMHLSKILRSNICRSFASFKILLTFHSLVLSETQFFILQNAFTQNFTVKFFLLVLFYGQFVFIFYCLRVCV